MGIDLDNCFVDGKLISGPKNVYKALNSYTEKSPSGKGLRIFTKGKLPEKGFNKDNIEIYGSGRYLTIG